MWPDQVSNPAPLTYESGALPNALRGLAPTVWERAVNSVNCTCLSWALSKFCVSLFPFWY